MRYICAISGDTTRTGKLFAVPAIESLRDKMMNEKLLLIGRLRLPDTFKTFIDRTIRERRRDERRLAERRTTKHQHQARNSCVADARSYRIARRLPVSPSTIRLENVNPRVAAQ
jgi:hypothetical protein